MKTMSFEEIKKEAFWFIGNEDENAEIIPDGNINDASDLVAKFIHHLWKLGVIYDPNQQETEGIIMVNQMKWNPKVAEPTELNQQEEKK